MNIKRRLQFVRRLTSYQETIIHLNKFVTEELIKFARRIKMRDCNLAISYQRRIQYFY